MSFEKIVDNPHAGRLTEAGYMVIIIAHIEHFLFRWTKTNISKV